MRVIAGIVFFLFSLNSFADDLAPDEAAVWALENVYYQSVLNNDPDTYLSLFHEDSIGWPAMDPLPKGRDKVSQWIAAVNADPAKRWGYKIDLLAIQSFGEVVVVHYRLREFFLSATTSEELSSDEYRISHSWLRVDDTWQVISGMGGKFN